MSSEDPAREASPKRTGFAWRKWNRIIHRDVGYVVAALTVIYAISGIAVNHTEDWNPNYKLERTEKTFEPFAPGEQQMMRDRIVAALKLEEPPESAFRSSPHEMQLFYDGWNVHANVTAGTAVIERTVDRPVLRDANFLHLNHPKRLWTWIADLFAVGLAFLGISGLFMLKGKTGLAGRGKWLSMIGLSIPLIALVVLRYLD